MAQSLDIPERFGAIDFGLAGTEQIEVRAVEDENALSHDFCLLHRHLEPAQARLYEIHRKGKKHGESWA
jgi:hypothetical protein